jgi:hypothetical protein
VTIAEWQPWELVYSAAWSIFGMIAATSMFRRVQPLFAEYV